MFVVLRILGYAVAAVLYAVMGLVVVSLTLYLLSPMGWVFLPAFIVGYVAFHRRLRRQRATAILTFLEQAVRLHLPLAKMVEAQAAGERGLLGWRLRDAGRRLAEGHGVARSLERSAREVPPALRDLIAEGERVGRLPEALRYAVTLRRQQDDREPAADLLMWAYPLGVTLFIFMVVSGLMLFVIPSFITIFDDFETRLPDITIAVIEFARWFAGPLLPYDQRGNMPVPGVLLLMVPMLAAAVAWLLVKLGPARPAWDRVAWRLPWHRAVALSQACHIVELTLRAGRPTADAADAAGRARHNAELRQRFRKLAGRLRDGAPLGASLAKSRLPRPWPGLLAGAERTGNLPDAFGFLSRHYAIRAERWATFVRATVVNLTTLGLAVLVGFIVVAMFMPLAELIWSLLPSATNPRVMP